MVEYLDRFISLSRESSSFFRRKIRAFGGKGLSFSYKRFSKNSKTTLFPRGKFAHYEKYPYFCTRNRKD